MTEQVQTNDFLERMMREGNGGGGGGDNGAGAGIALTAVAGIGGINLVDTQGIIPDTSNQHLGLEKAGFLSMLDGNGHSGLGGILADLCQRLALKITHIFENSTEGLSSAEGGGSSDFGGGGGEGGGGEGGGGGGGGDSGIEAPSSSGDGGDFHARVHSGNFDMGGSFPAEHISDGGFIGAPGPTPDMGGGASMGHGMD